MKVLPSTSPYEAVGALFDVFFDEGTDFSFLVDQEETERCSYEPANTEGFDEKVKDKRKQVEMIPESFFQLAGLLFEVNFDDEADKSQTEK